MITDQEREDYTHRFNVWLNAPKAPQPTDAVEFLEDVLIVFSRDEEQQRNDRQANDALEKALKLTQKAINVLTAADAKKDRFSVNYDRNHKLLVALETAYYEAGEPKDKGETHHSYYNSASNEWIHWTLTAPVRKQRSKTARLIIKLEVLWFSEFKERPTTHDESKFYIFAGHLMGIDPDSVNKQRSRTVPPAKDR